MIALFVIVSSSLCSESKSLAVAMTSGINLKGSFVSEVRIAFQMMGQGMKVEEPSKPTRPFSFGTGMSATFWAVLQSESSVMEGTTIRQSASADFKSTLT